MKIVVALDSFKGTMRAPEACRMVAQAIHDSNSAHQVLLKPMADGGEGTADAMIAARGGEWVPVDAMGPLPDMKVRAGYAWFPREDEALVEMAAASGLPLLTEAQRNPLKTTTYGTGELLRAAFGRKPRRVLLAVGGSATVDGGVGAAMALGWKFLDARGRAVGLGGGMLSRIRRIEAPESIDWPPVDVLCDVDNPLCGPDGAARVYAPQKGATPDMVGELEKGLVHLASQVEVALGKPVRDLPGGGAAGGLAAGAMAFMNAGLVPGIEAIMDACGLDDALAGADWVITGEGRFDEQSLRGKVVSGVVRHAADARVRVAVLAGCVDLKPDCVPPDRIAVVRATQREGASLEASLKRAREDLYDAALALACERFS